MVFHVLNRGVGRRLLFTKDEDFLAVERVVVQIWWLSPFLSQALEAAPGFIEARRYRAVVLARQGEWERATRDINWCLCRRTGGRSIPHPWCGGSSLRPPPARSFPRLGAQGRRRS